MNRILLAALAGLGCAAALHAREIGFLEDFSLADDRSAALKQLIPGTEDYYYYTCLHAQNSGRTNDVAATLDLWIKRYGYTDRVRMIRNRQALLGYATDPKRSLDYIRKELGLNFDHRRVIADQPTTFPSRLDSALIGVDALTRSAFARYQNLQGVENAGLDLLPAATLDAVRRRDLLARLTRPDLPGLPQLVVDDLRAEHSGGFGSLPIHNALLLDQLLECARLMPELTTSMAYVKAVIPKLAADDDADLRTDRPAKRAYLERLAAFTRPLPAAFNSLKAHALYQLLDFDRHEGRYDADLFMEYVKLPRNVFYINPVFMGRSENRDNTANLSENFQAVTRLPPVGVDEELVRDYLSRFFITAADVSAYAPYIRDDYLKSLFVETKIVNGLGDMEQWYSQITPDAYQALKERVDLDFPASNRTFFAADEPVVLGLNTKNIGSLIVKVFEINAFNYYRDKLKEFEPALDLDGLVATDERVVKYDDPPLRRVLRPFAFPQCAKPGVYVVEWIGNGRSSRVLVRKGYLHAVETIGPAGHEFVVLDEANRRRPAATIWLGGREYKADGKGVILVPYSTEPGNATLILKDGDLCSLATFRHRDEQYELKAGFYVDRESLVASGKATVIVRPVLTLNGYPVSLSLLRQVKLVIRSFDKELMATHAEVADFALAEDRESTLEFTVPDNFRNIAFSLTAKVRNVSRQRDDELSCGGGFGYNGINVSPAVEELLARQVEGGYLLELLGKNGEAKAGRPVHVELKHRAFRDTVHAALQTDAAGRIALGPLDGIDWFKAQGPDGNARTWRPGRDEATIPANVHGLAGRPLKLPFFDTGEEARLQVGLLEKRGSTYVSNRLDAVRFRGGFMEIAGLPVGDYELFLKRDERRVTLRLTDGGLEAGCAVSRTRTLEQPDPDLLQITDVTETNGQFRVALANATPFTRLHVFATRYMPAYWVKGALDYPRPEPGLTRRAPPESVYVAGRDIGDEYRYVLDRKFAEKFPGSLLGRPSLLLAPWSIRQTEILEHSPLVLKGLYGSRSAGYSGGRAEAASGPGGAGGGDDYASLDFLREPAAVLLNLRPDSNGVVTVERSALGAHPYVRLVAVDPVSVVSRHLALADAPLALRDLRLPAAMNAAVHYTEQKVASVIAFNGVLELKDIATSEFNLFDSLDSVYSLLVALSGDETLLEFRFILDWPNLKPEGKRELYGKLACHELNVFLYHKDRPFFNEVILPFLKNKKDKTFMDQWLTGADLSAWTKPWAFGQLNVVEQALLARRGAADPAGMARFVKERADMIPPDPEDYNRRFDAAIRSSVLGEDAFGFEEAQRGLLAEKSDALAMQDAPAPAPPPPAAAARPAPAEEAAVGGALRASGAKALALDKKERVELEEAKDGDDETKRKAGYFEKRAEDREVQDLLFRKLDSTEEWAEDNYYHLPIEAQNAGLVKANPFWSDYARHDGQTPFLSPNVVYAATNFTEVMLALAVLDLPFKAQPHASSITGSVFTLKAGGALIAFRQEILESAPAEDKSPILVSQNYYRADDRYRYEGNERFDKFVTGEFLAQTAYGCQVVLVNPTSSRQTLRMLLQIPQGALPVQNGFLTRGLPVTLEPYATQTFDYYFYFPAPGQAPHYPVQVAREERFVAGAAPVTLNVVAKLSRLDTESWDYVSQNGTPEEALAFLAAHNLNRIDLERAAWRMKDRAFFDKTIALLEARHVYHDTLWSYGLFHNATPVAAEYLKHSSFADRCGSYIDTALLRLDPVERKTYQHLEYAPLVNARAHQLGRKREILNDRFFDQYQRFLAVLSCRPVLDQDDLLGITYYLLLQDRVGEAMGVFRKVDPARIPETLQYDYFQVVMDFYRADTAHARAIVDRYRGYPVPRWRNLFADAGSQLDELAGKAAAVTDADDRLQAQSRAAARAPGLDFKVESRKITLHYQNIESCRVNYYPMDIELLFSRNPFVQQQTGQFAFVRPAESQEIRLPAGETSFAIDIPKRFYSSNVMVEIVSGGIRQTAAYYANSLAVQVIETYGQVQVADEATRKPLSGVYVKAYARMKDGKVAFYKDGYTDLRGRFDYASLNSGELEQAERFSLLILSEAAGAVIREAAPPKR